jgi:hypothetical protein
VQSAWAAARIVRKRNFFTALFYRVSSRAGMKKAAVAVAHRILVIVYSMFAAARLTGNRVLIISTGSIPSGPKTALPPGSIAWDFWFMWNLKFHAKIS